MMAKTFPRLALLAALLLSAFQGCSDADVRCLGRPVECSRRSANDCIGGCSVRTGCLGEAITCDTISDNDICQQTPGCELRGSCEGLRTDGGEPACEDLPPRRCQMTDGCVYSVACVGGGTTCDALDDDLCGLYPQCAFQSQCTGQADACGDLDSVDECRIVPGCYPADTDPSVTE